MTNPTQINLAILAPSKSVESPDRWVKPNRGDQSAFDHYLDREVNQPHLDRARRKERPEAEAETPDRLQDRPAPTDHSAHTNPQSEAAQAQAPRRNETETRETAPPAESGPQLKSAWRRQDKAAARSAHG